MKNINTGQAGTLMSCDALIIFRPGKTKADIPLPEEITGDTVKRVFGDITIKMQGPSVKRYTDALTSSVLDVLRENSISECCVDITDRGALDFIIKARLQTAIDRSIKGKNDKINDKLHADSLIEKGA
jgi:citrate lyase acyl carrier protein